MRLRRRELMIGAAALNFNARAGAEAVKIGSGRAAMPDDYFLSARNPIANADQRYLDALAVELLARPDIQKAKQLTSDAFARVTSGTVSKEVWGMLPSYVDSYCFRSIQIAVNSDADHPRVYRVYSPAAKWLGNDVPESRWGQENPDNCYRIIPIGHGGRYVVHGQRQPRPPSDVSYVLVADTNTSITVGLLGQSDLEVAADGSFQITLDEMPANGRRNHIQVTPDAQYLFIRDTLGDWRQTPNALRVERINPPTRGPLSKDELAARAARVMHVGVAPAYYWARLVLNVPVGTLVQPHGTGPSGGLLTQISAPGWFALKDGEAAIVTFSDVLSAYRSIVLYDIWGRTLEYRDHLTSMNNTMMVPDDDGRFSFVIAATDPGVHNWLDTMGLHEVAVGLRWQGIFENAKNPPHVETRVAAMPDLKTLLPVGIRTITREQRAKQLLERQQTYDMRFVGA
jgi:hypothetical protein